MWLGLQADDAEMLIDIGEQHLSIALQQEEPNKINAIVLLYYL